MSRSFNGTTDQIAISAFALPTAATLSAWVKFTSLPSAGTYKSVVGHSNGSNFFIILINGNNFAWYLNAAGGIIATDPGSATLSTGQWYHALMSYDGAAGLKTFVNGVSDGTQSPNGAIASASVSLGI